MGTSGAYGGTPGWGGVGDQTDRWIDARPAGGSGAGGEWSAGGTANTALRAAGLPLGVRIHDLRHTCAALLITQGAHPKAMQVHLGHSSITVILDRYGHMLPDDMDRLARGLDATRRAASAEILAASPRPAADGTVFGIEKGKQKRDAEQRLRKWP